MLAANVLSSWKTPAILRHVRATGHYFSKLATVSTLSLGATQPPVQWLLGQLFY
jgi:hypothetical protein